MASRPRNSGGSRPLLVLAAVLLFAGGIYLGLKLAEPPPRPNLPPEEEVVHDPEAQPKPRPQADPEAKQQKPAKEDPRAQEQRQPPPQDGKGPRIAIVIDDLGRSVAAVDALLALGEPITFAVLPFESETRKVVHRLQEAKAEMILHLPMEARGSADPGPGALLRAMERSQLQEGTRAALAAVPGIKGVNNHMGSALAADERAMEAVLEVLRDENLFFLDSRTAADTRGYAVARRLGLPAAERQVFLDNDRSTSAIVHQLHELFALAKSRGGAIAIAHPYPETLAALRSELPKARNQGIEIVPASQLLDRGPASP